MRRILIICTAAIVLVIGLWYLAQYRGFYLSLSPPQLEEPLARVEGRRILLRDAAGQYNDFEVRGVDMGAAMPGKFATEFPIKKDDYLRWFGQIKAMGANILRVYTIQNSDFYHAFYEYNQDNPDPLYLLHGLWLDDYTQFSHMDAYNDDFLGKLLFDSKLLCDVIHGNRIANLGPDSGSNTYTYDISPWVAGYILGVEWEDITVTYTNHTHAGNNAYNGKYLYTAAGASPFEAMLAQLGDSLIDYETTRYGHQRLLAFSNWPTTDPFTYSPQVAAHFRKCAYVDVEHILARDSFKAGMFASYHIYPYYPDYLRYEEVLSGLPSSENTYREYLKKLAEYHSIPLVISEFGVPSSRGKAQNDANTGRNQGGMSEKEQAQALVECYRDICEAGAAGGIVFTWQDEWFKRTWNAMAAVDLMRTPYWSDYQTNEQYFGVLSFDPGAEACICYVDGDISEWEQVPVLSDENGLVFKMLYDERFIYFMAEGSQIGPDSRLSIPLDITPKSGALHCDDLGLDFERAVDFVIDLQGENSRVMVQERYCVLRITSSVVYAIDNPYENIPPKDGTDFWPIDMLLQTPTMLEAELSAVLNNEPVELSSVASAEVYETGLLTMGNANPDAPDYNSLADYCYGDNCVEIKLPWQLLNFSDPSEMRIHDDYYEHYGVEYLTVEQIYAGLALDPKEGESIALSPFPMSPWGNTVSWHERLKPAYYALQQEWTER